MPRQRADACQDSHCFCLCSKRGADETSSTHAPTEVARRQLGRRRSRPCPKTCFYFSPRLLGTESKGFKFSENSQHLSEHLFSSITSLWRLTERNVAKNRTNSIHFLRDRLPTTCSHHHEAEPQTSRCHFSIHLSKMRTSSYVTTGQ